MYVAKEMGRIIIIIFFVMLNKMLLSTSGCSSLVHMFVLSCALQGQKGGDMTSFCSVDMGGLCGKTNDPKINLNRKKKTYGAARVLLI